ncbi:MAG: NRDE family protein [Alphaproteobacteria bacterium]|nr:NRDE family protein [Alphaproteobacteria bacterium]
MCISVCHISPHPAPGDPAWIGLFVREEALDRPSAAPAQHWNSDADAPARHDIIAHLDKLAGGSQHGVNSRGVCAVSHNAAGTIGTGEVSRGEAVLTALEYGSAEEAVAGLKERLDPEKIKPFYLLILDKTGKAYLVTRPQEQAVFLSEEVPPGLVMLSHHGLTPQHMYDGATFTGGSALACPRIPQYLPRFLAAALPSPQENDWREWNALVREDAYAPGQYRAPENVLALPRYGVVSATQLAMYPDGRAVMNFAPGAPTTHDFYPVDMRFGTLDEQKKTATETISMAARMLSRLGTDFSRYARRFARETTEKIAAAVNQGQVIEAVHASLRDFHYVVPALTEQAAHTAQAQIALHNLTSAAAILMNPLVNPLENGRVATNNPALERELAALRSPRGKIY